MIVTLQRMCKYTLSIETLSYIHRPPVFVRTAFGEQSIANPAGKIASATRNFIILTSFSTWISQQHFLPEHNRPSQRLQLLPVQDYLSPVDNKLTNECATESSKIKQSLHSLSYFCHRTHLFINLHFLVIFNAYNNVFVFIILPLFVIANA
jgi:hypothetical protein